MDDEMLTQLRTIAFSEERKGFDKGEVRDFLAEVANWVEGGGGDVVRRRLERIAHKSANMLADAEAGAESLRREAEEEAREMLDTAKSEADAYREDAESEAREQLREAHAEATSARETANQYATDTRAKADAYADQTRFEAKRESEELHEESQQEARKLVRTAEQRSDQIIAEANRQREAIETVIGDLASERDAVMANARKLARDLEATVDGVQTDDGTRKLKAVAPKVDAPKEQTTDRVEELLVDPELARKSNGLSSR